MKTEQTRHSRARGVSLPLAVDEKVEKRLEELKPMVKGFSHYVQLLVDWDLRRKKSEQNKDDVPFNQAEFQLTGLKQAA